MLDLAAEGRFGRRRTLGLAEVATLQAMKTGALIEFACRAGAILGRADAAQTEALVRYGRAVGQAFQIADDLIDVESDSATAGKATGKDAAAGKATFLAVLGRDAAVAKLSALVDEATRALDALAQDTSVLRAAATFIAARRK
jgi:farnesyl diphosphate synthase